MAARSLSLPRLTAPRALPRLRVGKPRLRTVLLVLVAVVLLVAGWMWFRDSSLVAANEVTIVGVHGAQAGDIRHALHSAAGEMTTLHMRPAAFQAAAAQFTAVASVNVTSHFPHKVRITVVQHLPVAAVDLGGQSTAIAEDGTILRGVTTRGLPPLHDSTPPVGHALTGQVQLAELHILAAAPAATRDAVSRIYMGPRGLTVRLKAGPVSVFGSADRARAKWASLLTILQAQSAAGATLIDVSVPEKPAVAGLAAPTTSDTPVVSVNQATAQGPGAQATAVQAPATSAAGTQAPVGQAPAPAQGAAPTAPSSGPVGGAQSPGG